MPHPNISLEEHREYMRLHRLFNLEHYRQKDRDRRKANPEIFRERDKLRWKNNPNRKIGGRTRLQKWRKRHADKKREECRKRRAMKLKATLADCSKKLAILARECFCHWCCIRLIPKIFSIDHVIPLSRGGHHIPDNLVACCRKCNLFKNDRLISEWNWETV